MTLAVIGIVGALFAALWCAYAIGRLVESHERETLQLSKREHESKISKEPLQ